MNVLHRAVSMALVMPVALAAVGATPAAAQDVDAEYAAMVAAYERDLAAYHKELARKPDDSVTFGGLTGLFKVTTPDTLQKGHVSFGIIGHNWDRKLTDVDVTDVTAAVALGITDRFELGVAVVGNRQTDFDDAFSPRFYNNLPAPVTTIEDGGGDLTVAMKLALARIEDNDMGLSLFYRAKFPVADERSGRGTGGVDVTGGLAAGMTRGQVGLFGDVAFTKIGDASSDIGGTDLADMFNWGAAFQFGARSWASGIVEFTGEHFVSVPSGFPDQEDQVDVTLGFKLGGAGRPGGVSLGGAYVHNLSPDRTRGYKEREHGWIGQLSFTTAPPPPVAPVKPPPPNHDPTCSVSANPKTIYPITSPKPSMSTVTCRASDPDGDPLSYTWSTTGGRLSGSGPSVTFTPPEGVDEGQYTITCKVTDGRGGRAQASDTVNLEPDVTEPDIGRVQFEFDRYDLDDEDRMVIRKAALHLRKYPELRLMVEGHTCYIATEEYNLALGQQRADSIRDYLAEQGVDLGRVRTISYGEARPWQDNSREITRRLNRRGEFRFRFSR